MNIDNIGGMNIVDILILAVIIISFLIGLARGLLSEVLSLAILIASFAVAILFTNTLATYFASTASAATQTPGAVEANATQSISYASLGISFAILFLATMVAGIIIKWLLNLIIHSGGLGFSNRILGACFGFARGWLLVVVAIFLVQLSSLTNEPWWQQSNYVPYFQSQVVWLGSHVSPTLADLKEKLENAIQEKALGTESVKGEAVKEGESVKPEPKP